MDAVYLRNVIFELYKAALAGEITQSEFIRVKEIAKRAKVISPAEIAEDAERLGGIEAETEGENEKVDSMQ